MKLFISYAVKDIIQYKIPEIISFLDSQESIEKVFYWERDCAGGESIIEYMKRSIKESDAVVVFCSEEAQQSQAVQQEIGMALILDKLIVPVWAELTELGSAVIPPNLRDRRGHVLPYEVWYNEDDYKPLLREFCEKLYFLLTGQKATYFVDYTKTIEVFYKPKEEGIKSSKVLKIMLMGDGGVGKSAVLVKYIEGLFISDMHMTRGVDFTLKTLSIDGDEITLQLWDCGGQDRYSFMLESYFPGANGALLFYDLTRFGTTFNFKKWIEIALRGTGHQIPIMIIGNKADIIDDISIDKNYLNETIEELGSIANIIGHSETSAKTGQGIDQAFQQLSRWILAHDENIFSETVRGFLGKELHK